MAALCNRAGHIYFHPVVCSSSSFLASSQRSEIRCLPYFHTWCGLSANLGCRSVKHAARGSLEMQGAKNRQKVAICAPSHNFVGLYLRNSGTYRQTEKTLLSSNTSSTCADNMVNFGPLAAEINPVVCSTPANYNGFRVLATLLHHK